MIKRKTFIAGDIVLIQDRVNKVLDRIISTHYSKENKQIIYALERHNGSFKEEDLEKPATCDRFPDLESVYDYLNVENPHLNEKDSENELTKNLLIYNDFLLCSKAFSDYYNSHSLEIGESYYSLNIEQEYIYPCMYIWIGQPVFHTELLCKHALDLCGGMEEVINAAKNWVYHKP